jgi:alpha-glucosidase
MYVSVPYLIIKQDNLYAGILINNPFAVFMSTPPEAPGASKERANHARPNYYIGSPDGVPEIYFLAGPTFAELTSKLQRLVGTTPLPPLWALGHQQCRYGYAGYKDLDEIERKMKRHRIPNDGIWLDIDYMDGYRVFSFSPRHWRNPKLDIEEISSRGKKVVPILDPGVKVDLGYAPYNDGIEQDIFCKTPENKPFQGFVWPGLTVFPDFSTDAGREWWAGYVERFAQNGVAGAWLDMNDPAVGHAELDPMRFGEGGKNSHETFHNQDAFGMAKASREGFLRADENTRPFLLARSGYISSSRYSAIWTGDNASNAWFFKQSLSVILGLAISGIPFNGADVGGFGDDVNKELLVAWYKSAFLLPFFRNHTCCGTHRQEPWAFDQEALETIRHFIRLRYTLLPYIYNLFIDQEENGEAIVRPLFYDFEDEKKLPLGKIDDQYMLGRSIMHAPILQTDRAMRDIALPKGLWFDAMTGIWIEGGSMLKDVETTVDSTPLYIRSGSIIPMLSGSATDNNSDLSTIECHIFLCPSQRSSARYTYRFDDGKSFAYKRGERTIIGINAYSEGRKLKVDLQNIRAGYKSASIQFVVYGPYAEIELTVNDRPAVLKLKNHPWIFAGAELNAKVSAPVSIG